MRLALHPFVGLFGIAAQTNSHLVPISLLDSHVYVRDTYP
jgi:hypothetical protein